MDANKQSGPAFPVSLGSPEGHQDSANTWQHPGLTKRELFAAMAMQGVMAMQSHPDVIVAVAECAKEACKTTDEYIASNCVSLADALLAELAKEPQA